MLFRKSDGVNIMLLGPLWCCIYVNIFMTNAISYYVSYNILYGLTYYVRNELVYTSLVASENILDAAVTPLKIVEFVANSGTSRVLPRNMRQNVIAGVCSFLKALIMSNFMFL